MPPLAPPLAGLLWLWASVGGLAVLRAPLAGSWLVVALAAVELALVLALVVVLVVGVTKVVTCAGANLWLLVNLGTKSGLAVVLVRLACSC